MLACVVTIAALSAHPLTLVQLRYPVQRVTITTTSGYNVMYTLPADTPQELKRAYKVLEFAEREVLISEALQLLRMEIVANERKLENLRAFRLMSYLGDARSNRVVRFFDPAVVAPPESALKFYLAEGLAADARIERMLQAIDRLADAHFQLQQTLTALAFPDRKPAPLPRPPVQQPGPAAAVAPVHAPARPLNPLAEAERVEHAAAAEEALAEARERAAREMERAADGAYRNSPPGDRAAARAEWLKARDEWEGARREWDAARDKWQATRDHLDAARRAYRAPATPAARPTAKPGTVTRTTPYTRPR
jgi:hypothetical protein